MKHPLRLLPLLLLVLTSAPRPAQAQQDAPTSVPERPAPFVLSAAHPNPFSAATRFTLRLAREQHVRVEVFNVLGQRVRLLHDGPLEAGEPHAFAFEGAGLPSGLYLYRARGERFVATRQVTLLQ